MVNNDRHPPSPRLPVVTLPQACPPALGAFYCGMWVATAGLLGLCLPALDLPGRREAATRLATPARRPASAIQLFSTMLLKGHSIRVPTSVVSIQGPNFGSFNSRLWLLKGIALEAHILCLGN